MSSSKSSDCSTKYDGEGEGENKAVPAALHVPLTLIVFIIFVWAIQQLLGAPTRHPKVFKYRTTVAIACGLTLLIAICLNFELEQDQGNEIVDDQFVYFVQTLMVLYLCVALLLGYWFVIDAVGAAYKATNGIVSYKQY